MKKLIAIVLILSSSCTSQDKKPLSAPPIVHYTKVERGSEELKRIFAGVSQFGVESKLSFRVPGKVHSLNAKVGDEIRQGDLIAALDDHDYKLQADEVEASLDRARAQQRLAKANYHRFRDLYETKSATRTELDAARAESESWDALVDASESKYALAKSKLGYTNLFSPITGTIAEVHIEENEHISAGQPILRLTSNKHLEVSVPIPEIWIAKVKEGMEVEVTFSTLPTQSFASVISEVGVDSLSKAAFTVIVEVKEEVPIMRAGMAAEVIFTFPRTETKPHFFVPSHSIIRDESTPYVFVAIPQEGELATIEKRSVSLGSFRNEGIEVLSGLKEGDLLVIAGIPFLSEGLLVRIED